jgi:hypothetical protein
MMVIAGLPLQVNETMARALGSDPSANCFVIVNVAVFGLAEAQPGGKLPVLLAHRRIVPNQSKHEAVELPAVLLQEKSPMLLPSPWAVAVAHTPAAVAALQESSPMEKLARNTGWLEPSR